MFKIGNVEVKNKVVLAPLAGYTNRAFRMIAKEMGVGLVYTEMMSAKGLIYENDKTWDYVLTNDNEHPVACQLFGGVIEDMVAATKLVNSRGDVDIIDINMGCPVRKVLKQEAGSKMLTDPSRIEAMVKAVVEASDKPVSVKIRAGWDHQSINCVEVAKAIERAGASLITIHGRTRSDLYGGKVNLEWIKAVKDAVRIPVIGNGDIMSVEDAKKMLDVTGVDAVMIGRGSLGNPWLLRDIVCALDGKDIPKAPTGVEKIAMIKYHFEELLKIKPEKVAILEMRTLAAWYAKGAVNCKEFKKKILETKTKEQFYELLNTLKYKD